MSPALPSSCTWQTRVSAWFESNDVKQTTAPSLCAAQSLVFSQGSPGCFVPSLDPFSWKNPSQSGTSLVGISQNVAFDCVALSSSMHFEPRAGSYSSSEEIDS